MPAVEVLTGLIGSSVGVLLDAHSDEESLNGPLQVLEEDRFLATAGIVGLLAVNADKGKTNSFNTFNPEFYYNSSISSGLYLL